MNNFPHGKLTYYLRGIGFRIHNALKGGHAEQIYEEAVVWILDKENIPYSRQPKFLVDYKKQQIGEYYPDLTFAGHKVIVDLKAAAQIEPLHKAQVLSYTAVSGAELGFIMNFGAASFQTERLPNFLQERKPIQWHQTLPTNILYPKLTNHILGSLYTVHHALGPGFLSQLYRRATRIELADQLINFEYIKELPLIFENQHIATVPTRIFLIDERVMLVTIAVTTITQQQTEKLRWAMQATKTQLGIIANFYPSRLDIRFLRT